VSHGLKEIEYLTDPDKRRVENRTTDPMTAISHLSSSIIASISTNDLHVMVSAPITCFAFGVARAKLGLGDLRRAGTNRGKDLK